MRYFYVAAWLVDAGFNLADDDGDVLFHVEENCRFTITRHPDDLLTQIDRKTAIRNQSLDWLLRGLKPKDFDQDVEIRLEDIRSKRGKEVRSNPVLVVEASGDVPIVVNELFHAYDVQSLKEKHSKTVDAFKAGMILACQDPPRLTPIAADVFVQDANGKIVDSPHGSCTGELTVFRRITKKTTTLLSDIYDCLRQDAGLEHVLHLYVDAARSRKDRIAAFILSWAALEVFVRTVYKKLRREPRATGVEWPASTVLKMSELQKKHSVVVRSLFSSAAAQGSQMLNDEEEAFKRVYGLRCKFFHEGGVKEIDLPNERVMRMLRSYLLAYTGHQNEIIG